MADIFRSEPPKRGFWRTFFKSFWPDYYHDLSQHTLQHAFSYFLKAWLLAFLIFGILSLGYVFKLSGVLQSEFAKIEAFDITTNITVTEPLHLPPSVVVANAQDYNNELLLITAQQLSYRDPLCLVLRSLCLYERDPIVWKAEELQASLRDKTELSKEVYGFFLLMIPGIVLGIFILYGLKYLVLILLASFVMYLLSLVTSYDIPVKKLLVMAFYSSTLMMLIEMISMPYVNLYFVPFVVYIVVLGVAVMLVSHKKEKTTF